MFSLEGKVAVITGGGRGLGKVTAERFAKAGAKVVIANVSDGTELAQSLGGRYIKTDVSKKQDIEALMSEVAEVYGRIDILCNNAGIEGQMTMIDDLDNEEELARVMAVNVNGCLWCIKYATPHMPAGSSIVNTTSIAGIEGVPTYAPYVMSKSAVIGLTKTAAIELGPRGIRVNAIAPYSMDTGMVDSETVQVEMATATIMTPAARLGRGEEFAGLQHFLASDEAGYISGQTIALDGGYTAGTSLSSAMALYEHVLKQ